VSSHFCRLVGCGLTAECRLVRCAAVRLVARASGLGGGMASFLVGPLLEALGGAVRGMVPGGGAGGAVPPLADARRLLEVMVPLAYKPTIKVIRGSTVRYDMVRCRSV
jgi:hypothetical protein